jgi:hypothetical protein
LEHKETSNDRGARSIKCKEQSVHVGSHGTAARREARRRLGRAPQKCTKVMAVTGTRILAELGQRRPLNPVVGPLVTNRLGVAMQV